MQELSLLNDKLDALLKKYALLQAENNRLRTTIDQQAKEIDTLSGKLTLLEENLMVAQMSSSLLNESDKDVVKKQLDTVLGEIDKLLATLND
ncbi:hypothetical protein CAP35_10560 [Chitinophagaceae bacterium IBVUCB1]|nr:hypothetical protein CAP35_10560 [Chitinophagaceae bacterium IBVUCB1]